VPLRALPPGEHAALLSELWNETFARHWGWCPLSPEITALFVLEDGSALDTSVIALSEGRPLGFCFVMPDDSSHASFAPGRTLRPSEKLNMLAIGVRQAGRGRGVNYAMAAHAFLELVRRGWKDDALAKLAGGNVIRALAQAETVAARLQRERPASTATIEALDQKATRIHSGATRSSMRHAERSAPHL